MAAMPNRQSATFTFTSTFTERLRFIPLTPFGLRARNPKREDVEYLYRALAGARPFRLQHGWVVRHFALAPVVFGDTGPDMDLAGKTASRSDRRWFPGGSSPLGPAR